MKTPRLLAVAAAGTLAFSVLVASPAQAATTELDYQIDSPYAGVNWSWNQYKSGFHNHTTESDGGNSLRQMIDTAYGLGFNVYAATDHNVTNESWVGTYKKGALRSGEQPDPKYYYTQAEVDAMAAGAGRDGKPGLIGIPHSNEQSVSDHLNTFWTNWNNGSGSTLESKIAHVNGMPGQPDPLMHINHPGRYYGGSNTTTGGAAAVDPVKVARYVNLFRAYPDRLVGMEIVNKVSDGDSYSDRILWDSILAETLPALNVWGYSNDDAHSTSALGYDYNMLLMPELSEKSVHNTMKSGAWYSTALVAKRELGANFRGDRTKPAPSISKITVDQQADSITIEGANYTSIEWIADGKVIATGNKLELDKVGKDVDNYVRAQLKGSNGISFTNAFGISLNTKGNEGRFLSDSQAAKAALASVGRTTAQVEVKRDFGGNDKVFVVTITTAEGVTTVRVNAETGAILK